MTFARKINHAIIWQLILLVFLAGCGLLYLALGMSVYWWAGCAAWLILFSFFTAKQENQSVQRQIRALSTMIAGWRDSEFSISIKAPEHTDLAQLTEELNLVGELLRQERQGLVQRELLLQTVIQNSPMAVVLYDASQHIILANLAARNFCADGKQLNGQAVEIFLGKLPAPLQEAVAKPGENICTFGPENNQESYHISRSDISLNGQTHTLLLIRTMTRELNRQEVAVWKKIIRVMSHEINNSLAPIVSLSNNGLNISKSGDQTKLEQVFNIIAERAQHLNQFISGYAGFAKLPKPNIQSVPLKAFLTNICTALNCRFHLEQPEMSAEFDPIQVEQILINLVRNALEAGSSQEDIELDCTQTDKEICIEVRDQGQGMEEDVLSQALLPFYSTKRNGSGLGLALAREIMEAHQGRINISPRKDRGELRGIVVSLYFLV